MGQAQRLPALHEPRLLVRINGLGFVGTVAATFAVTRARSRTLDLAYHSLVATQQAVNAVFRSTTTVAFRDYSPGLVTSMLTVPLWRRLTGAALAEKLLTKHDVVVCTVLAGIVHAAVVARQVFFVGVPASR